MIKLLFWIALIGGAIGYIAFLLKRRNLPSAPEQTAAEPRTFESVRCRQCGVYLPIEKSIQRDGEFFCSQEHAQKWLGKKAS